VYARFDVPYQPAMAIVDSAGEVNLSLGAVEGSALDAELEAALAAG